MKFRVTFKSPDAMSEAIHELLAESNLPEEDPWGNIPDKRGYADEIHIFTGQWIRSGEYVTIEFDTEANTATVVRR